ncbi:MAG: hypothetical protein S4CHLAM2_07540 [Chlamydiales bacterium]|nr:hypothetical protein [Chlamydiales bacterium]
MFFFSVGQISLLQLSFVLIPILVFAYFRRSYSYLKILFTLFTILLFNNFVIYLPQKITFFHFYWNWQGKLLEALWPVILVYVLKWRSAKETGFSLPKEGSAWVWAIILGLSIPFLLLSVETSLGGVFEKHPLYLETVLFQFSMPGLAEELVYRGIMLAVLNRYFDRPWKLFDVPIGWGLLCTTLLFTAAHIVVYSSVTGKMRWDFAPIIPVFGLGLVLGWLREKTESVWPCVVMHNFVNGFYVLGRWILAAHLRM